MHAKTHYKLANEMQKHVCPSPIWRVVAMVTHVLEAPVGGSLIGTILKSVRTGKDRFRGDKTLTGREMLHL